MLTHDPARGVEAPRRVGRRLAAPALVVSAAVLAACAPRPAERPTPTPSLPPVAAVAAPVPAGTETYDVVAGGGRLTLYVRRAGPLARLGHNHVLTTSAAAGHAWIGREPAQSGFEIRVPVAAFAVDDPDARAAAGADFAGEVPEDAREGTYRNLLRPEVLDADRFPEIVVRAESLGGTWDRPLAVARVTLKGATRPVEVPLYLERADGSLRARGDFRVRQTDFGMTPFSVAGGAVQVADEVEVRFDVLARRR